MNGGDESEHLVEVGSAARGKKPLPACRRVREWQRHSRRTRRQHQADKQLRSAAAKQITCHVSAVRGRRFEVPRQQLKSARELTAKAAATATAAEAALLLADVM